VIAINKESISIFCSYNEEGLKKENCEKSTIVNRLVRWGVYVDKI